MCSSEPRKGLAVCRARYEAPLFSVILRPLVLALGIESETFRSAVKRVDCKTVSFFLKISKEVGKAWCKTLSREAREPRTPYGRVRRETVFSLVPDILFDCSRVLEYVKTRTVLQSIKHATDWANHAVVKKPSKEIFNKSFCKFESSTEGWKQDGLLAVCIYYIWLLLKRFKIKLSYEERVQKERYFRKVQHWSRDELRASFESDESFELPGVNWIKKLILPALWLVKIYCFIAPAKTSSPGRVYDKATGQILS